MDNIWWNKVTNANHFLESIINVIQERQNVVLQLPNTVPWYGTMRDIIENEIRMQNSDCTYKYIVDTGEEPGAYLLREFCKREKRAQYRPAIGYAEFLAKSDDIVLNDYILWIAGTSSEQVQKWQTFVVDYNKALAKVKKGCLFIIEMREECNITNKKGIKIVSFNKEIEYYDNYLFNMLAASNVKESELLKKYLAEVVSSMIPNDIELASYCVSYGKKFLENPLETIRCVIEQESRSDGSYFQITVTEEEMQERLWEAQIKIIFPLIEKHRNAIATKYKSEIEACLPIAAAYGEVFTEVGEVEIGTISYLQGKGKIQMSHEDAQKASKLKSARNDLAHLKTLKQKDVDEIFSF